MQGFVHFYFDKILVAKNRDRVEGLIYPLGTENVKRTGFDNLAGGSSPNSSSPTTPVNSHPVNIV